VSSGGTAPVLARLIRARIEALVPPAIGRLAAIADEFKAEIRRRLPDTALRRRVLERALGGRVGDLVAAGQDDAARREMARQIEEGADPSGIVYLVGAGPGAADLLTLRAHRLLGEADVIVHDRLVSAAVLDMARRDADRIYVGKVRAHHCVPQEGINDLLVRLAREGRKVVRLKGGDPFIFGRGGEEAEALAAAGVAFEVVPGVTAALGCAAQAGIPLTHRAVARTVTFATGHTKFAAGLPPGTPAALIERGGSPAQRTLTGTLDELVEQGPAWSTGGPALVLIGEAVGRRVTPGEAAAVSLPRHPAAVDGD
jgi:uroporphyrin-III C-methyltransferase/precorrin-2 dehydrogenase/sirohydrochlorin ferrochelatase